MQTLDTYLKAMQTVWTGNASAKAFEHTMSAPLAAERDGLGFEDHNERLKQGRLVYYVGADNGNQDNSGMPFKV